MHRVVTRPAAADSSMGTDVYGNSDFYFHVTSSHRQLDVISSSLVEVRPPALDGVLIGIPWEQARPLHAGDADAVDFVVVSPRVDVTTEVRSYTEPSFPAGRPLIDAVSDLMHRIHADREGVCQDFAHLAVAALRSVGLAGRYVSGYLATDPPPGKERMVGVDATHAWAAVWLPGGSWLAFDPTNDQLVDERYATVAWGRDYGDVPPLRGVIFTDATTSKMKVSVDVAPVGIGSQGPAPSQPLFDR